MPSSGPFTTPCPSATWVAASLVVASNLSSVPVPSIIWSSQAHPTHVGALSSRTTRSVSGRFSGTTAGGYGQPCAGLPVAFRRPGVCLLRHPVPAEDFSSPHGRPTRALHLDLNGVATFRRCETRPGWPLLYPGAAVSSRPAGHNRSAPAASQRPALPLALRPVSEGGSDETSTEIHAIGPSDLPLARSSRTEREAFGVPPGFTPRRYQRRMPGWGQVSRTLTRGYTLDISRTSIG
jgi:hypothetical protein